VWLLPSLIQQDIAFPLTEIALVQATQGLNNEDSSAVGFHILLPTGRLTAHDYPSIDATGIGWDNWYRNYDRGTPGLNVDAESIDNFIAQAKSLVSVDERRVFMSGWSNGAAMAIQYALMTPGIAAASVYSAPDAWRDVQSPCAQPTYPQYATPIRDMHNYQDILGIQITGLYFYQDLTYRFPQIEASFVVIDDLTALPLSYDHNAKVDESCAIGSVCATTIGVLAHMRYPVVDNKDVIFEWLLKHPLPESGSWPYIGAPLESYPYQAPTPAPFWDLFG
jgi:hypothetical protein